MGFCFVYFLYFIYLFVSKMEKKRTYSWVVREVGRIWEELEERKNMIWYIVGKNFQLKRERPPWAAHFGILNVLGVWTGSSEATVALPIRGHCSGGCWAGFSWGSRTNLGRSRILFKFVLHGHLMMEAMNFEALPCMSQALWFGDEAWIFTSFIHESKLYYLKT